MDRKLNKNQIKTSSGLESELEQTEDLKKVVTRSATARIKKLTIPFLVAAFLAVAGVASYFWYEASALKKDPQKATQQETQKLLADVSKLIILPEDETPTIAIVTDPERLKGQTFFAKAQKGDKVLIYTNAKKAILYSPSENKIIEVAPINIGNPAPSVGQ